MVCIMLFRFIKIHVLQKYFEHIKGVITSGNSKKDRQHNDQKKKRTDNTMTKRKKEQTNTTQRTKD